MKTYYRLGSIVECAVRRVQINTAKPEESIKSGKDNFRRFAENECIEHDNSVWVPLEQVAQDFGLTIADFLDDEMLDILNNIKNRTGHYPIKTF